MKTSMSKGGEKAASAPLRIGARPVPAIVHEVLRSPGQPLDAQTRNFMEPRFGHDFSNIRVHTSDQAAAATRAVNALAYTVGRDVVFGANQFAPASARGRELLGHELAHTIQQRNGNGAPPAADQNSAIESTASLAGREVANGKNVSSAFPACGIGLACAPTSMHLEDDEDRARKRREAQKAKKAEAPKASAIITKQDKPQAPIADTPENRAVARAELLAQIAVMGMEEITEQAEELREAAERNKPVSYLPTTLSMIKPDKRYDQMQYDSEKIERELAAKKKAEAAAEQAKQKKEDEDRPNRFETLRIRLRHGMARSVIAELLSSKLTMRDLQILKKHGLTWPRRGPSQQSVIDALDDWANSSEENTPDAREYESILASEKKYFEVNYANYQRYNQKSEAIVNSGPGALVGRVVGTAIDGEHGGDIGANIGGMGDSGLMLKAAYQGGDGQAMQNYSGDTFSPSGIYGEPPEPINPIELQPDRPTENVAAPAVAQSGALENTQPAWAFDQTEPSMLYENPATEKAEPSMAFDKTEPGPPAPVKNEMVPAAAENSNPGFSMTSGVEEATPAEVRAAYKANSFSVQKSGSDMWHQMNWEREGGQGPAPIAFRMSNGTIRVNEVRWLAVGDLSEINTAADLAPRPFVRPVAGNGAGVDPLGDTGAPAPVKKAPTAPMVDPKAQTQNSMPQIPKVAPPRGYTPVPEDVAIEAFKLNPYVISPSYSTEFHQSVWKNAGGQGTAPLAYRVGDLIRVDVMNWPVMTRALIGQ